jgi:hypothetical protein
LKIIRYFIREENLNSGMEGFIPLWVPRSAGFDPSGAAGLIHDALEHRLCDTGKPFEEVLAFGRIIALRYMPGVLSSLEGVGAELQALVRNAPDFPGDWDLALPDPGRVELPEGSDDVHDAISLLVKGMAKMARNDGNYGCGEPMSRNACTRAARLLRLGFLDGMRRYGGYSGCSSLGFATADWAERSAWLVEDMATNANNGDVLRLSIDTHYGEVKLKLIDNGQRIDWLRPRLQRWYSA